ncbi:hypothetical protein DCC85_19135 [Paenibacillus sp. CAA11]|nr:hypothetical protein DCC85_19135 [Paenibacillus sp. CAA11]
MAYKKLFLPKQQALLAKELLLNGDYTYYDELESLYEGGKETFYRSVLSELRATGDFRIRQVYLRLVEDKNPYG